MTELHRIRDQLRRAIHGGAWHGPALMELLAGVDAPAASARPLGSAHTIWEIVLHVDSWLNVVRRRVEGETVSPAPSEDWPPIPEPSPAAWAATLAGLSRSHEALDQAMAGLGEEELQRTVAGKDYDVYFMLHGSIQHVLYHAGQTAILRK